MRINLNVPYAEKDQAKRFGALWDMARKVWYVEDLSNLRPFLKWMPAHLTRPATVLRGTEPAKSADKPVAKTAKKSRQVKSKKAHEKAMKRLAQKNTHFIVGPVTPRTDFSMFDPGCSCVPWEWCEHNPEPANLNTALVASAEPEYRVEWVAPEHLTHIRSILAE